MNNSLQQSLEIETGKASDKDQLLSNGQSKNLESAKKIKLLTIISVISVCVLIASIILNLFQAGYFDSDDDNNSNLVRNECNGNGIKYHDTNLCECYQCYSGSQCQEEIENCTLSAGSGQPHLFVEYWQNVTKNGELKPIEIPIDYRVPYQSSTVGVYNETDNTTFPQKLSQLIRRVHRKYHNCKIDGKYLVFGVGASQLNSGAYTAWSVVREKPIIAFNKAPYYMLYPTRCAAATPYHCSFNTSFDLDPTDDTIREILTIPNNPDGWEYEVFYPNQSSYGLDLVYYWPHFYESNDILQEKDAPITFFSFTKFSGHAASRFGWAFVDSYQLASEIRSYISRSVMTISIESLRRAWDIFSYIERNGDDYFDYVRQRLAQRWEVFNEIFEDQDNFIQLGRVGSQYGWVECVGMTNETEIRSLFESYGIRPSYGSIFGSPGYVRFSLAEFEGNFVKIMQRFKQLVDDHR